MALEWSSEIESLLVKAAALAAERGLDAEAFMRAAWTACLDAQPGLREQIAEAAMSAQVEGLRKRGLVGAA
jgi:hypothetical protein